MAVLGAALLGFALRMFHLGEQSLWYDEAFSVLLAQRPISEIIAGTAHDTMPPLYYLLLHAWGLPANDFWVRFPSAFLGTLAIPLTYVVGARLLGPRVGVLAAWITASVPFQVFFGQEVRMYSLLGCLTLLTVYWFLRMGRFPASRPASRGRGGFATFFVRGQETALGSAKVGAQCIAPLGDTTRGVMHHASTRDISSTSPESIFMFIVSGGLLVYTHALAWLVMGTLGLWWLLSVRGRVWRDGGTVLAFLGVVVVYLPWASILLEQARRVQGGFWTPPPTALTPLTSLYVFVFGPFLPPWLAPAGLALVLLTLALTVAATRSQTAHRDAAMQRPAFPHSPLPEGTGVSVPPVLAGPAAKEKEAEKTGFSGYTFALFWLATPLVTAFLLSQVRPIYLERTLIGASYGLFILLAWGLSSLHPRPVAWTLGVTGLCLIGVALGRWYVDPAAGKPPLRAVAATIAQDWQAGDVIVHTGDGSSLPFLVYLPDHPQALLAGDPEHVTPTARGQSTLHVLGMVPVPMEQAASGHRRAWLVVAPDHSIAFQRAAAETFGHGRTLVQEQDFRGVTLRLYQ